MTICSFATFTSTRRGPISRSSCCAPRTTNATMPTVSSTEKGQLERAPHFPASANQCPPQPASSWCGRWTTTPASSVRRAAVRTDRNGSFGLRPNPRPSRPRRPDLRLQLRRAEGFGSDSLFGLDAGLSSFHPPDAERRGRRSQPCRTQQISAYDIGYVVHPQSESREPDHQDEKDRPCPRRLPPRLWDPRNENEQQRAVSDDGSHRMAGRKAFAVRGGHGLLEGGSRPIHKDLHDRIDRSS